MFNLNNIYFNNFLFLIICIFIIIIIYNIKLINYDSFLLSNTTETTSTQYIKNDGTKLYGSLFLDNLNDVIVNMTDPPINYDTKRIELNKYSDVLL
jgi:hypothetical protein